MNFEWQNLLVLLAVAAAGAYLARLAWQSVARRGSSACGRCGDCPNVANQQAGQMVPLERLSKSAETVGSGKSVGASKSSRSS